MKEIQKFKLELREYEKERTFSFLPIVIQRMKSDPFWFTVVKSFNRNN